MYNLKNTWKDAYSIVRYVCRAMKREWLNANVIKEYREDTMEWSHQDLIYISEDMIERLNDK